ncbi:hypothetical protein [Rhizobium phaseoli]|uniref:hypothetical protein n=1 Tax=Rhizobium phaseoli TaxID=396 RepID=UPI0011AE94BF|nr:hypothetical protein [Rhizobium phaseoli]
MTPVILLAVALFVGLCVLAFTLAIYAMPLMIGLAAGRSVVACGAPLASAALVGVVAAVLSFAVMAYLQAILRNRAAKLAVAVVYATPAAIAGYALMLGVLNGVRMEDLLRYCLCVAGGGFVAISALLRLTASR